MTSLLILYSLSAAVSYAWPDRTIGSLTIELIAFGNNTETVTDFGPFGFRSYPNYWGNLWSKVKNDLSPPSRGYSEDWPIVEDSQGNTLALYISSGQWSWEEGDEAAWNNVTARLNNFDPDTLQQYMRAFINTTLMFQVKGASAPTQGLLGDPYSFTFDTCIVDDPPKIWLTTQCQMKSGSVAIWSCEEPICDLRAVFSQYIFPNAELIRSVTGSGVNDYLVDIQFDFAYTSYCDLQSDIVYNGGEITASAMEATLLANFPPITSGNVTKITLDCDVVALTCINSNYCTWTLPWLHNCGYAADACDTTTTTQSPTKAPVGATSNPTAMTENPSHSPSIAPVPTTPNPSRSPTYYNTDVVTNSLDESHEKGATIRNNAHFVIFCLFCVLSLLF